MKWINIWIVLLVRLSGSFLKWTKEELQQMVRTTRKLMTEYKALHPRDDIDILDVSRKRGGKRLISFEDSVDASIRRLKCYRNKHKEIIVTATRNNTNSIIINRTVTRIQKWGGKLTYGYFKLQTSEISHEKTWTWKKKTLEKN